MYEFRSITIIAHQHRAKRSIAVKTLFISIASFDCFSLLIVRGGLWPPAHSRCHLCWQAAHLFTESLNQILVLRMQKAQQRWEGGKLQVFIMPLSVTALIFLPSSTTPCPISNQQRLQYFLMLEGDALVHLFWHYTCHYTTSYTVHYLQR